jgi:hypothetical protein
MATVLIRNGCYAGALAGIMAERKALAAGPTAYASVVAVANAIASQCITANAALVAPMADADNANIFLVCYAAAEAALIDTSPTSTTATDYAAIAAQIVALAKESVANLL